jgi:hypothetical protein
VLTGRLRLHDLAYGAIESAAGKVEIDKCLQVLATGGV